MALQRFRITPSVTIFLMSVFSTGVRTMTIRSLSMISRKSMVLSRWAMIRRMTEFSTHDLMRV